MGCLGASGAVFLVIAGVAYAASSWVFDGGMGDSLVGLSTLTFPVAIIAGVIGVGCLVAALVIGILVARIQRGGLDG